MIYYRKTLFGRGPKLTAVQFSLFKVKLNYPAIGVTLITAPINNLLMETLP